MVRYWSAESLFIFLPFFSSLFSFLTWLLVFSRRPNISPAHDSEVFQYWHHMMRPSGLQQVKLWFHLADYSRPAICPELKGTFVIWTCKTMGVGAEEEALVTLLTDSYLSNGQSWAPIAATGQTVFRYLEMIELYSPVCLRVCVWWGEEEGVQCSWVNKYLWVITSFGQAVRVEWWRAIND